MKDYLFQQNSKPIVYSKWKNMKMKVYIISSNWKTKVSFI